MTREEEIQKLIDEEMGIDNYGSCDFQVGVCYGVKHADKTMLDRMLKYLEAEHPTFFEHFGEEIRKAIEE